ncbi:MAG: gliding motility protein GldL [Tannerellaceae bacterium]|jgi:gliding motility-associated protein GldL|nr:gliding motility protein GldL [Tannerellaceae bacterium]
MGKYKSYKNRVEMFLGSDKGKRTLNFCYSWGASVVILGAMFKILHLPYGNHMLAVGMITEFLVFFIFGFERPINDYRWEDVFPVLKSKNPLDRPDFAAGSSSGIGSVSVQVANNGAIPAGAATQGGGGPVYIGGGSGISLDAGKGGNISDSIQKVLDAADRIAKIPELVDATQRYLEQISRISDNLEQFGSVTDSLSGVSSGISSNSQNYIRQMETLSRNVAGLNTIYEIQLKSISSQINSIEHINAGLNRIKELYDGSIVDSSVFRSETEKMAQQLAQLNMVYARLLQAMTVNMGIPK